MARSTGTVDKLIARLPGPVETVVDRLRDEDVFLLSAGLGFYALVSIAPLVIFVLWIATLILGDQRLHHAAHQLQSITPSGIGADQALVRVAKLGSSVGIFAIVTGLWPATAYGAGLSRAFTKLTPQKDVKARGLRGRALALVVLLPLFVIGVLVASFAGTALGGGGWLATVLGWAIALATGFAVAGLTLSLMYRVFPPVKLGWTAIWRGTLTAAVSISLLSLLFTIYLELGSDFQSHYATSGLVSGRARRQLRHQCRRSGSFLGSTVGSCQVGGAARRVLRSWFNAAAPRAMNTTIARTLPGPLEPGRGPGVGLPDGTPPGGANRSSADE
ncbi:MAG: YihY/virulence factor BrkB family protein [Actinomycetota bacterium]|nr:YihY/virulence factor BrkB family protein [Actinomycetota bacterium]